MAVPTDILVAAATVTYGGTSLGSTKGGVSVEFSEDFVDIMTDQMGSSILDKRLQGQHVTVTVPIAEYTQANLGIALGRSTSVGSTLKKVGSAPGASMLTSSARLVIRPDGTSGSQDIIIHKADVESVSAIGLNSDSERIIEVVFRGIMDLTRSAGDYLIQFGDSTAT